MKHKIPRFPPAILVTFKRLCRLLPEEQIDHLRQDIEQTLSDLQVAAKSSKVIDLELGRQLADRCRFLLDIYKKRSSKEQALIAGAVCYFAASDDPVSEEVFASGFYDDARVINHVLEQLGIEDRYIELP